MLLQPPRHAFSQFPIIEYKQKRHAENTELRRQILIGIDIQLADSYLAFGFDPKLVDDRCHGTTGRSPRCPGK